MNGIDDFATRAEEERNLSLLTLSKYLLLAECKVRTASYGPSFFSFLLWSRIRCNDCNGTYIGETGRTLTTRLGEHQTATDKEDLTNNIAQHHRKTGHDINWDSATCLTHSTDKDQRLTLESWFTNLQPNPLNRSRKLPAAYERLLQSEYRTADENAD